MPSDFWMRTVQEAEAGRLAQAIASARIRQRTRPRDPEASELLGMLLMRSGEAGQAAQHLRRAAELEPGSALLQSRLAEALMVAGQPAAAIVAMRQAASLAPRVESVWLDLSAALLLQADVKGAAEAAAQGLAANPASQQLAGNRAIALARAGRIDEAIEGIEAFLARHPEAAELRSNLLLMLQYSERDPVAILEAHRAFGRSLPAAAATARRDDGHAPLRVGILSSDLRGHSVGFFVEPLLRHAPDGFEVVAFSNSPYRSADAMRDRLKGLVRTWHEVHDLDDPALERLIRSERIDVLLELNGHTGDNRLTALARRPAPLIVTAIGYPDTTGVPAIDLRLVDSITDPPGSDSLCTERPLRIDPCFLCYTPPIEAPEPAMPPAETPITFGSFNNIAKVVPSTVALWSRALRAVPDSRLLLKSIGLDDPSIRTLVAERFAREGIDPSRIDLRDAGLDRGSHLALYGQVHVALDPTPYNGTTTTCEALWMGVPVVTLQGHRHASRVSSSLLTACGCVDWIARDADSFTRIAAKLAADRESLARIRASLRGAMRASPLLDAPAYAQRLFAALAHLYSSLP